MKGAREYAKLFNTGQYEKLYISVSSHARGDTFRIQVLPEGEEAKPNGGTNPCLNSDAVEVYGVISGNLGWTEQYGWKHEGKWQEDFEKLVIEKTEEIDKRNQSTQSKAEEMKQAKIGRNESLLSNY